MIWRLQEYARDLDMTNEEAVHELVHGGISTNGKLDYLCTDLGVEISEAGAMWEIEHDDPENVYVHTADVDPLDY